MTRRPRFRPVDAVLLFLGTKFAMLAVNLPLFPTLSRTSAARPVGDVSLLIPMRDEAARLPSTLPGLLAAGAAQLVFLDDGSTDGSADLVRTAADAAGVPAQVLTGAPRPAGWVGKTWACAQLGDAATGATLVFCDADVALAPGALAAVIGQMDRQRADVFSVFGRQRTGSWPERLLTPLITDVLLCFLPFPLLRAPARSAATANGSLLAFRRPAYDRLGGFAAVRSEIVEDVAMARHTRRSGLQLGLALGGDQLQTRMYRSYAELVAGLGRGLAPTVGGRRWLVAAGLGWHLLCYTVPPLLAARSARWRWAAVLGIVERLLVEAKSGGRDWPAALAVAASPVAAIPVVAQAVRRRQTWKGRQYG